MDKTIYLACAYNSKGPFKKFIMWWRWRRITKLAASIMNRGVNVFSPITHSHPIGVLGRINQTNHEFWLSCDKWFVDRVDELWVYRDMLDAWSDSYGVNVEIRWAKRRNIPIKFVSLAGDTYNLYPEEEYLW